MHPDLILPCRVISICYGLMLCSATLGAHPITGASTTSLAYCSAVACKSGFDPDFGGTLDLSSDPQNANVFWAVTQASLTNNDIELVRIDLGSAEQPQRIPLQTIEPIIGLAIDPNYTFYGITDSDLVRLDPNTGAVENIGSLGYGSALNSWSSIASHPDGTLYGAILHSNVSTLVTINKATGAHEDLGVFEDVRMQGLDIHPTSLNMQAIGYVERDYRFLHIDPIQVSATIDRNRPELGRVSGLAFVDSLDAIDCNGDFRLDIDDFQCQNPVLLDSLLDGSHTIRGDFDFDGEVGFEDFLTLQRNFGQRTVGRNQLSYVEGDMNLDRSVKFDDFLEFSANYGKQLDAKMAAVPEPCGMGPWLIAIIITTRTRSVSRISRRK